MVEKPKNFAEVVDRDCCRWMGGDLHTDTFCGEERIPARPYCVEHTLRSRSRVQPEKGEFDGEA